MVAKGSRHPSRALAQLVDKACRRWELRRQAAAARPDLPPQTSQAFTIAVAREIGVQGTAIAERVGDLLDWHVYDHELLEKIAQDMGLRTALMDSVDERQRNWLWASMEAFLATPFKSEWMPLISEADYFHHLVATVRALGIHGECVIVGRGAAFLLPPESTLRVRLVGPVSDRIKALRDSDGISDREAAGRVRTIDRERHDFIRDHFHKDPEDPRNYDLVFNPLRFTLDCSAELIVEALHRLEARERSLQPEAAAVS